MSPKPKDPKTILSGWCGLTATPESHNRCTGGYAGLPCRCQCHAACPTCGRSKS